MLVLDTPCIPLSPTLPPASSPGLYEPTEQPGQAAAHLLASSPLSSPRITAHPSSQRCPDRQRQNHGLRNRPTAVPGNQCHLPHGNAHKLSPSAQRHAIPGRVARRHWPHLKFLQATRGGKLRLQGAAWSGARWKYGVIVLPPFPPRVSFYGVYLRGLDPQMAPFFEEIFYFVGVRGGAGGLAIWFWSRGAMGPARGQTIAVMLPVDDSMLVGQEQLPGPTGLPLLSIGRGTRGTRGIGQGYSRA